VVCVYTGATGEFHGYLQDRMVVFTVAPVHKVLRVVQKDDAVYRMGVLEEVMGMEGWNGGVNGFEVWSV
jgi:hypothetical protein